MRPLQTTGANLGSGTSILPTYNKLMYQTYSIVKVAEELANDPSNYVNVAKIDVHMYQHIGTRFDIRGFPTIKLISKGKVYEYGGARTVSEILNFARGGFSLQDGEATPSEVSVFGEVFLIAQRAVVHGYKQAIQDINDGNYFSTDVLLVSMPVIFLILTTVLIFLPVDVDPPANKALKAKKKFDLAEPDDADD